MSDFSRELKNLDGLFKFCMREGAGQQYEEMDPERAAFLRQAMQSIYVDESKVLLEKFQFAYRNYTKTDEESIASTVEALESVADLVENIDLAVNFFKMNGLDFLCILILSQSNVAYQILGAQILATCAQNNLNCQEQITKKQIIPKLVDLFSLTKDVMLLKGLIGALSCTVRSYDPALQQFMEKACWNSSFYVIEELIYAPSPDADSGSLAPVLEKFSFMIFGICASAADETLDKLQSDAYICPIVQSLFNAPKNSPVEVNFARALAELSCDLPRLEDHDHESPPYEKFKSMLANKLDSTTTKKIATWCQSREQDIRTASEPSLVAAFEHLKKVYC